MENLKTTIDKSPYGLQARTFAKVDHPHPEQGSEYQLYIYSAKSSDGVVRTTFRLVSAKGNSFSYGMSDWMYTVTHGFFARVTKNILAKCHEDALKKVDELLVKAKENLK